MGKSDSPQRVYVREVREDGIALMGGGLAILFAGLAIYFAFVAQHSVAVFWLLALSSFCLASYRVWLKEYRGRVRAESLLERPKLTGAFHDIETHFYYDETKTSPDFMFTHILGTEVIISVSLTNDNPATPTTLHNFALKYEMLGKEWVALHAQDVTSHDDRDIWPTHEHALRNEKMINLVTYLGDPTKHAVSGTRIEGYLVFRLAGLGVPGVPEEPRNLPEEGWPINITLSIEDAWGQFHLIKDRWASLVRPSLKLATPKVPTTRFTLKAKQD